MPKVKNPVLWMCGEKDGHNAAAMKVMQDELPGSQYVVLPGAAEHPTKPLTGVVRIIRRMISMCGVEPVLGRNPALVGQIRQRRHALFCATAMRSSLFVGLGQ